MNRRIFLKRGASAFLSAAIAHPVFAAIPTNDCVLSFYNTHTGERLKTCYRKKGKLNRQAMYRINYVMRDHRTGDIKAIDPQLMDQLHRIVNRIRCDHPIHIISGYRSPQTNATLRKASRAVAKKSLHMDGRAIDIRIPGVRTAYLRRLAVDMAFGGVGYYPGSDFVHLDTGPFKVW
jgi:uncharacterized protein YcbK (DUF882 family)